MIHFLLFGFLTFVELNCENLFDTIDNPIKRDEEFLPQAQRHWNTYKYWQKLNRTGQTILSCGNHENGATLPDIVALCEVESDTVLRDLTRRSLLRAANYKYIITDSPDERGINTALLYAPYAFRPITWTAIHVDNRQRPTRDILYVKGEIITGDTIHIMVVHAPSRAGGQIETDHLRQGVAKRIMAVVDSIRQYNANARLIIAGDFNDYTGNKSIRYLIRNRLTDITQDAKGKNGAKGTYRYQGVWGSLDHIICDEQTARRVIKTYINDAPFLTTEDKKYGGRKPRRNYQGPIYQNGFSDHLPLVAVFRID